MQHIDIIYYIVNQSMTDYMVNQSMTDYIVN